MTKLRSRDEMRFGYATVVATTGYARAETSGYHIIGENLAYRLSKSCAVAGFEHDGVPASLDLAPKSQDYKRRVASRASVSATRTARTSIQETERYR